MVLSLSCHVRDQVSLELVQVDIQGAVKSKRGSNGRDNLSNQSVQVDETWRGDVEVLLANVIDSFIVNLHERERKENWLVDSLHGYRRLDIP